MIGFCQSLVLLVGVAAIAAAGLAALAAGEPGAVGLGAGESVVGGGVSVEPIMG